MSQFSCCPLIWMCQIKKQNKYRIHERCFHLIYNDKKSSLDNLLDKDKSVSIQHKTLGVLQWKCIKNIMVFRQKY